MKHMRKLASLLLALVMVFAMATTAFADGEEDGSAAPAPTGSITIPNAAMGETYSIYKLFSASVTGTEDGPIAYTGDIPEGLEEFFTKDSAGNISATAAAKDGDKMSTALEEALKTWAETATATATDEGKGSALVFDNLDYGYYVVTTTQGEKVISVDSTNPDATIYDKNSTTPKDLTKAADKESYNIGDTVTYTVSFTTSNYSGSGDTAKKITEYVIEDTLPDFLTDVTVTSITVDNDPESEDDVAINVTEQFDNKKITLDWVDAKGAFKYENGAVVTIVYTATLTEDAAIDGAGNTNEVTVTWADDEEPLEDEDTIYTYAIALKKVSNNGSNLAGAKFELPFYVKATPDTDGAYIYAGKVAADGLINQIVTPDNGEITIKGVDAGTYEITEIDPPAGYNKLTAPVTVTAVKTGETKTEQTFYIDADGKLTETQTTTTVVYKNDNIAATAIVVVNQAGSELPSTGGMGTTLFYIFGGIMVLAAVVLLVTKKRMSAAE